MPPEHLFILSNGTSIKIEFFPKNVSILEETRISNNNFQTADSDLFEIVTTKSHSEIINSQHLPTEAPKELKDDVEVIDEGDLFQDTCIIQVPEFKSIQIIYVEIKNKKALDDKAYRKEQFLQFRNKISEWASSKKMTLTVERTGGNNNSFLTMRCSQGKRSKNKDQRCRFKLCYFLDETQNAFILYKRHRGHNHLELEICLLKNLKHLII